MNLLVLILGIALPSIAYGLWEVFYNMPKIEKQHQYDRARKPYQLVYPRGTTEQGVQAFLRSIGSDLIPNNGDRGSIPTIVPEVRWTETGIKHIIRMTPQDESHVLSMLEAHLPGITIDPIDTKEEPLEFEPTYAVDVRMTDPNRNLRIESIRDFAVGILHSVPATGEDELVSYQLIASHTENIKVPQEHASKSQLSWWDRFTGKVEAPKEEIVDRKQKVNEQNFNVTIRIAARAADESRAQSLVGGVVRSLRSAESNYVKIQRRDIPPKHMHDVISYALTPRQKTAQFTVSEFAAFLAAPILDPAVPGLPQGSARRVAPNETVPRDGRQLGYSNLPSMRHRPVALGYDFIDRNTIFIGGIGSGKSVGMANNAYDDMLRGMGVFVIDASASESAQSLYSRVLDYVPDSRKDDVINIHVRAGSEFPVAFDLFRQGLGRGAIDQIVNVFTGLYPEINQGVSVRELLYHGLWTLIDADLNLVDLAPLLRPRNAAEAKWAQTVVNSMKDQELRDFWDRMKAGGFLSNKDAARWERYTDPLYRRLWQLNGRPEIRFMLGQSVDEGQGLNWETAIREHKIVLVSLGGLPSDSAQIIANLMTNFLWSVAQKFEIEQPGKPTHSEPLQIPNALYLDEFQVSSSVKDVLEDMLARSRKHGLPETLGTQYISSLDRGLQNAVLNNVQTRVISPLTASDEARIWQRNNNSDKLSEFDYMNGKRYEPIVQIPTSTGNQVLTIHALNERPKTGNAHYIMKASRDRYGVPVAQVRQQIADRHRLKNVPQDEPEAKPGDDDFTL